MSAGSETRRFAIPPLFYTLVALLTTWPLAASPRMLLGAPIGPGDPYLNLWILGWGMQTVLSDPLALLTGRVFDANIFHPAAGTLAYSDHMLLQSVVLAPVYALTGDVVLCYNLLLIGSLVASALAMHIFIRSIVGTSGGAYLAGLAWGFGSYRFAHLQHLQLQALYFLPFTFLAWHRLVAGRRRRDAMLLGVLVALQAMSSVYYAVIGSVALAVAGVPMAMVASRRAGRLLVTRLVLAVVVAAALVLPVGLVYWRVQQTEGFGRNLYEASRNAAFADSYLQAPPGNLLYGRTGVLRMAREDGAVPHTGPERELFPGVVLLALALAGLWAGWRSDARPLVIGMGLVTLAGLILSLGPDGVRPLYAALHRYVFGFQAIRAPARFGVLVMFGLATLAAVGWRELSPGAHRRRIRGRVLPLVIMAGAAIEYAHLPVQLVAAPPRTTDVGRWLKQAPGSGAVAILPLGLDIDSTPAMVQSLEHRRPILNGYSGQRPPSYTALVDALSDFPSDEAMLALHESGVQYVVTPAPLAAPPTGSAWPLVQRAQLAGGTIYEMAWTDEIEGRMARAATVIPAAPGPIPFAAGERARYAVSWDGAGVNLVAGEIVTAVDSPPYRFTVTAVTAPWVSRFFEAQDTFTTLTDPLLLPRLHVREQHEGARNVTRSFVYDHAAGLLRLGATEDAARSPAAVTLPLAREARDAIAALFYVRTLALDAGRRYQIPVNEAGRNLNLELVVTGREMVTLQGRQVEAIRLDPAVQRRVERRAPARAVVWISADERRIPLAVDVDAGFGRVRLELVSYEPGS